jgi:hypothetical protein
MEGAHHIQLIKQVVCIDPDVAHLSGSQGGVIGRTTPLLVTHLVVRHTGAAAHLGHAGSFGPELEVRSPQRDDPCSTKELGR